MIFLVSHILNLYIVFFIHDIFLNLLSELDCAYAAALTVEGFRRWFRSADLAMVYNNVLIMSLGDHVTVSLPYMDVEVTALIIAH